MQLLQSHNQKDISLENTIGSFISIVREIDTGKVLRLASSRKKFRLAALLKRMNKAN